MHLTKLYTATRPLPLLQATIGACSAGGEWKKAIGLVDEMNKLRKAPLITVEKCYLTAIAACAEAGQKAEVARLKKELEKKRASGERVCEVLNPPPACYSTNHRTRLVQDVGCVRRKHSVYGNEYIF